MFPSCRLFSLVLTSEPSGEKHLNSKFRLDKVSRGHRREEVADGTLRRKRRGNRKLTGRISSSDFKIGAVFRRNILQRSHGSGGSLAASFHRCSCGLQGRDELSHQKTSSLGDREPDGRIGRGADAAQMIYMSSS